MRFAVIASGSRANCTYVESGDDRILIDCGLSAREAGRRLIDLGVAPESIGAILVTHEHSDHIAGIPVFSRRHGVPVYVNSGAAGFIEEAHGLSEFVTGESFAVGGMLVSPFSIVHDAADPVGFVIEGGGARFAQATDLGKATTLVRRSLRGCHALVLESNHDEQLLRDCGYPWVLKQRIASAHGHLSNAAAAALVKELCGNGLRHLVLGHLSENSNTPGAALEMMRRELPLDEFETFLCASAGESTPLIEVAFSLCAAAAA